MTKFVEDLFLVASNDSSAPKGPDGYDLVGYWDVDKGGSHGTGGTTGEYMMALYVKMGDISSVRGLRIGELMLTSSDNSTPVAPNGPGRAYTNIGYWDVDKGGAVGTNGTRGSCQVFTRGRPAVLLCRNSISVLCFSPLQTRTFQFCQAMTAIGI